MKFYAKKLTIVLCLLILGVITSPAYADNLCSKNCTFDNFFRQNYEKLVQYLNPGDKRHEFFNILFDVYSIKFKGIDYEYKCRCEALFKQNENNLCCKQLKKDIKALNDLAIEEYDSFLEDLNFEICEDENCENKFIKKHKKRYRKELKRLIAKNCR